MPRYMVFSFQNLIIKNTNKSNPDSSELPWQGRGTGSLHRSQLSADPAMGSGAEDHLRSLKTEGSAVLSVQTDFKKLQLSGSCGDYRAILTIIKRFRRDGVSMPSHISL